MIPTRPYKRRTHDYLFKVLKEAANKLQMRDFSYILETGDIPPDGFSDNPDHLAESIIDTNRLVVKIWIKTGACKSENEDPKTMIYHEMAHAWDEYCKCKERRANIIALLLEGQR